jgi:ElaB/YqjD/DUF883 family membrane-anchored ribosome-binding protein
VTQDALDERTDDEARDEHMTDDEQAATAEIRSEIEETRDQMGGTLNELGDRLEPSHLVDQAKEATIGRAQDTAKGVSNMVIETIKNNPIPAAIAGAGLAWLWANREKTDDFSRYSYQQQSSGPSFTARAGDAASTVGDNVAGAVGSVADSAQQVTGQALDRGREVGSELDRLMQANPLALGAVALGAGALVGSLLPETQQEKQILGDAGRQVGEVVRDTVDKASSKAEETLDRTEERIGATS